MVISGLPLVVSAGLPLASAASGSCRGFLAAVSSSLASSGFLYRMQKLIRIKKIKKTLCKKLTVGIGIRVVTIATLVATETYHWPLIVTQQQLTVHPPYYGAPDGRCLSLLPVPSLLQSFVMKHTALLVLKKKNVVCPQQLEGERKTAMLLFVMYNL